MKKFIKFMCSSGLSCLIDLGGYELFDRLFSMVIIGEVAFLAWHLSGSAAVVFLATFCSRAISSLFNYFVNRKVVFQSDSKGTMIRYYILVLVQLLFSALFVWLLSTLFGAEKSWIRTGIKAFVDVCLFFVSFRIQKAWVFK